MAESTTTVVGAVAKGNGASDFYPVLAWLRDTCIPNARPLYNPMNEHFDDNLQAAVLLNHDGWRGNTYELVIIHNHMVKRFTPHMSRQAPSWSEFTYIFGAK